jgi:hypothetical protein
MSLCICFPIQSFEVSKYVETKMMPTILYVTRNVRNGKPNQAHFHPFCNAASSE